MKPISYQYYKLSEVKSEHTLVFDGLAEFNRFVETQQLKTIFTLVNATGEPTHFLVTHKGGLLQQATLGFKKLEDYVTATQKKFPDAQSFYDAHQQGFTEYEDYRLVQEAGIDDRRLFEKIKDGGFITGFKEYQTLKTAEGAPPVGDFENAHRFYEYAVKQGFENFEAFKKAYTKGFTDADTFNVATGRGFTNPADFEAAGQLGFYLATDLAFAREHQLRDKEDAQHFIDIDTLNYPGLAHDQRVLILLLKHLEQGKKISIDKLYKKWEEALQPYRYTDTHQLPPWFTVKIADKYDMMEFLGANDQAKKYGTFDPDGEFFDINHLKDREVVLDGSNIAHNSQGNGKTTPYYGNVIKLIKYLKKKEFTKITVIVDASLRHRVADADKLPELKQLADFREVPKETSADTFIIQHVRDNHCMVVSNDTFREWKQKDNWTAFNIDDNRLPFMINNDEVIMPDVN